MSNETKYISGVCISVLHEIVIYYNGVINNTNSYGEYTVVVLKISTAGSLTNDHIFAVAN